MEPMTLEQAFSVLDREIRRSIFFAESGDRRLDWERAAEVTLSELARLQREVGRLCEAIEKALWTLRGEMYAHRVTATRDILQEALAPAQEQTAQPQDAHPVVRDGRCPERGLAEAHLIPAGESRCKRCGVLAQPQDVEVPERAEEKR